MTFNMNEVNEKLKPDSNKEFKIWESGVPEDSNVTYLRLMYCSYDDRVALCAVDESGERLCSGSICEILESGTLGLFYEINKDLGLKLDSDNRIITENID